MSTPTISWGGTTIDLGYPNQTGNSRDLDERTIVRRTLDGQLRTTILSLAYRYQLTFAWCLRSDYDALVALWRAAAAAGEYPLFDFAAVWPTADGVAVGLDIGPLEWILEDTGSFKLTLTEVAPRP
jgi:hypothetical protein